jgi:hypothetical protein
MYLLDLNPRNIISITHVYVNFISQLANFA